MKVIHIKDSKDALFPYYIGRANKYQKESPLHNPFRKSDYKGSRVVSVYLFTEYLLKEILEGNKKIMNALKNDLRPLSTLICYCAPKLCHGESIRFIYSLLEEDYSSPPTISFSEDKLKKLAKTVGFFFSWIQASVLSTFPDGATPEEIAKDKRATMFLIKDWKLGEINESLTEENMMHARKAMDFANRFLESKEDRLELKDFFLNGTVYKPVCDEDGVTHINIYSKGKTQLGRDLSHFADIGFVLDDLHFASVEGFWYWLATGKKHDALRELSGYLAKVAGKACIQQHGRVKMDEEEFRRQIKRANVAKVSQTPKLIYELSNKPNLPFKHYYVYGNNCVLLPEHDWIVKIFTDLRSIIQGDVAVNVDPYIIQCWERQEMLPCSKKDGRKRITVSGSRSITDYASFSKEFSRFLYTNNLKKEDIIVNVGGARGVDTLAERYCKEHKIETKVHLADWKASPRGAGYIRNEKMKDETDHLFAMHDGESKGTKHMMDICNKSAIPVTFVIRHEKDDVTIWGGF